VLVILQVLLLFGWSSHFSWDLLELSDGDIQDVVLVIFLFVSYSLYEPIVCYSVTRRALISIGSCWGSVCDLLAWGTTLTGACDCCFSYFSFLSGL